MARSNWCKSNQHEWCFNRDASECNCSCACHGRSMLVGDIYPCHTPQMKRNDDFRKIWMWYASQSDRKA